eukprot:Plantae.Rhodophyta-Purpureofilum_apyrenoidigerum.ctg8690.p1 GENE.Plantae.Rhodophyta-Purpureofilum_apyrenoidigerum.ctg8690~~Plantae.Rhodophyta-Purpureofilum_apyrenoidigerum.ctg8690.p1  ORF type:complete len:450 (-),score=92.75 Plantae.Rhodophyta-Purpureofilum_apyrenoidigerum.ctg8690:326-1675(-)
MAFARSVWSGDMSIDDGGEHLLLLAGDIGGTNSRFAAFRTQMSQELLSKGPMEHPPFEIVFASNFKNESFGLFKDVMQKFFEQAEEFSGLQRGTVKMASCCLAVAGPVDEGRANFTNRGWVIDSNEIKDWFGFEYVTVVNDFVASGFGILTLLESEVTVLQEGRRSDHAPIAVLGAGTGLGECFLSPSSVYGNAFYEAYPTEGGHVEFAPKTELQFECLKFLQDKFRGRVSVERIVSGKGLLNVYEFFKAKFPDLVNENLDEVIREHVEAGAVIASSAYDYALCAKTMDFVFEVYGTEAGSVALKYLPYGGLYVAGSLAPRNIERLKGENTPFMKAALDKGRVSPALRNVPIKVVMCEDLGMRGAQLVAYKSYLEANRIPSENDGRDMAVYDRKPRPLFESGQRERVHLHFSRPPTDFTFVTQIAVASSIAASVALIIGLGARNLNLLK